MKLIGLLTLLFLLGNNSFAQVNAVWDTAFFQNESCYDMNNGTARITKIGGGAGPYTIEWNSPNGLHYSEIVNEGDSSTVTSLYSVDLKDWQVQVIDNNGSVWKFSFDVQASLHTVEFTIYNPDCYGLKTGSLSVYTPPIGPGPHPDWVFDILDSKGKIVNNPMGSSVALYIGAGIYHIIFTDRLGCIDTQYTELVNPPKLVFSNLGSTLAINGPNGSVFCSVEGGFEPYQYNWSRLSDMATHNDSVWLNIDADKYFIQVIDSNGCSIDSSVSVGWLTTDKLKEQYQVKIYPNIIQDNELNIELADPKDCSFNIYDGQGRLVFTKNMNKKHQKINLDLSNGLYYYSINKSGDKLIDSGKIIVNY